jgi:hypothetical protein
MWGATFPEIEQTPLTQAWHKRGLPVWDSKLPVTLSRPRGLPNPFDGKIRLGVSGGDG